MTKNIPGWCVTVENAYKVIRNITEDDRKYYYKDCELDARAENELLALVFIL